MCIVDQKLLRHTVQAIHCMAAEATRKPIPISSYSMDSSLGFCGFDWSGFTTFYAPGSKLCNQTQPHSKQEKRMKILTTYMSCTADPIRVETHLCGGVMGAFVFPFAKHLLQLTYMALRKGSQRLRPYCCNCSHALTLKPTLVTLWSTFAFLLATIAHFY